MKGATTMKIAMLTNNYRPFVGGVPVSVERQARELIRLGHKVTVFAPTYGDTEAEDEAAPERVVRYHSQRRTMDNGMVVDNRIGFYSLQLFHIKSLNVCRLYFGKCDFSFLEIRNDNALCHT